MALFAAVVLPGFGLELEGKLQSVGLQPPKSELESIEFELESLEGDSISLGSFKGKIVLLNFWATWCGPCREEIPSMQELYEAYQDRGLEIIAVNLMEDKKSVQKFADSFGMTFPILLDADGRVGRIYGARAIPTTYLIDAEGYILGGMSGTRNWYAPEVIELIDILIEG